MAFQDSYKTSLGAELAFSTEDLFVNEVETITVTRGNRVQEYRNVWLRNERTKKEKQVTISDADFRFSAGHDFRLLNMQVKEAGEEAVTYPQAILNLTTGQVHPLTNKYLEGKDPFPWIKSLGAGAAAFLLFAMFGAKPDTCVVLGLVAVVATRMGLWIRKNDKYADVEHYVHEAIEKLGKSEEQASEAHQ